MHARLSTVCNYEITLDPLYASIIIAFYASAGETTTNFSVAGVRARKVVLHFSRSPFLLLHPHSQQASVCFHPDKLSSLFATRVLSLNAFFAFYLTNFRSAKLLFLFLSFSLSLFLPFPFFPFFFLDLTRFSTLGVYHVSHRG